ncbi:MAG TPA: formate dehydrogenase [Usitatibacter sp.]|nr:formate dehydrogenase [Usitatibacter sp.]
MKTKRTEDRRKFLLAAGLGGAGAAAVVAGVKGTKAPASGGVEAKATDDGYRETDHIRKYYKTTQV